MSEIIVVGATLGGVLLGALLTGYIESRSSRRQVALTARLTLADTYELIWGDCPHNQLVVHTEKLRAQWSGRAWPPT